MAWAAATDATINSRRASATAVSRNFAMAAAEERELQLSDDNDEL